MNHKNEINDELLQMAIGFFSSGEASFSSAPKAEANCRRAIFHAPVGRLQLGGSVPWLSQLDSLDDESKTISGRTTAAKNCR